ncbi:MAG TPA: hypothetical protein VE621_19320, partial [Bryobacteraceae bacterium]|nr:hypothetical protein [Bryobacteraceae bacterium]
NCHRYTLKLAGNFCRLGRKHPGCHSGDNVHGWCPESLLNQESDPVNPAFAVSGSPSGTYSPGLEAE